MKKLITIILILLSMSVFSQEKTETIPMNRNGSAQFKGTGFGDPARSENKSRGISKAPKNVEKSLELPVLKEEKDTIILKNDTIKINLQQ